MGRYRRLGIEPGRQSLDARRWADAAAEARDEVLETGAVGVNAARRLGNQTLDLWGFRTSPLVLTWALMLPVRIR
jgi:hypothetical protein